MPSPQPRGCLGALLSLFIDAPEVQEYPYEQRYLLSKAERSFYGVLTQCVGGQFVVFTKVRMADLVKVRKGTEKRQGFFNRIQSKHVDFVLCDPKSLQPRLVIELDDKSHRGEKAQTNDAFKDKAFEVAGLPLVRIRAQVGYKLDEVGQAIMAGLGRSAG